MGVVAWYGGERGWLKMSGPCLCRAVKKGLVYNYLMSILRNGKKNLSVYKTLAGV